MRTDARARTLHSYMHAFQTQAQASKAADAETEEQGAVVAAEGVDVRCVRGFSTPVSVASRVMVEGCV